MGLLSQKATVPTVFRLIFGKVKLSALNVCNTPDQKDFGISGCTSNNMTQQSNYITIPLVFPGINYSSQALGTEFLTYRGTFV